MAHKTNVSQDKVSLMSTRWCVTPFAFASLGKDFTLLQQQVLLRVSDHLQDYISKFFKDGRHLLPDDPLPLFSTVPSLKIPYSSLGVDVNNRYELYKAIDNVMKAQIKGIVVKDGVPKLAWINVFKTIMTDLSSVSESEYRNGSLEININEDAAAYAFNMRRGYINHPLSIAEESTREYAPRLYFLIKHKIGRSKKEVIIKYEEVRKELGVDIIDKSEAKEEDKILKHLHPQFAKFVSRVLEPACADINRMADLNLLDIVVAFEPVYPQGITRGNPEAIKFKVELSKLGEYHKDPKKAREHMQVSSSRKADTKSAAPDAPRKRGRPRKTQVDNSPSIDFDDSTPILIPGDRVGEWQQLVAEYGDGQYTELLQQAVCEGTIDGAFSIVMPDYGKKEQMVSASQDPAIKALLQKYTGRSFKTIQISYNQ